MTNISVVFGLMNFAAVFSVITTILFNRDEADPGRLVVSLLLSIVFALWAILMQKKDEV